MVQSGSHRPNQKSFLSWSATGYDSAINSFLYTWLLCQYFVVFVGYNFLSFTAKINNLAGWQETRQLFAVDIAGLHYFTFKIYSASENVETQVSKLIVPVELAE